MTDDPKCKRLLMLSIVNPFTELNGASTVTLGLLQLMKRDHLQAKVDLIPFRETPTKWHRAAQARSLIYSSILKIPAKAAFLYSRKFRDRVLAQIRNHRYDLVILNGGDLLWISEYLPKSIPQILVAHNIEHQLFRLQIENIGLPGRPFQELLRREYRRLEDYELKGMRAVGNMLFLSEDDASYVDGLGLGLKSIATPPVFAYESPARRPKKSGSVLEIGLLGNFGWWPNRLSVEWFCKEVLPHVQSPIRVNLFGSAGGGVGRWTRDSRVVHRGTAERIEQVWEACDLMICPTFATGGVCIKLAEALYNGMPVLATRQANRGLPACHDPALVFLDEPGQWIEHFNSEAARQHASMEMTNSTRSIFAIDSHKDAVQQFISSAIGS